MMANAAVNLYADGGNGNVATATWVLTSADATGGGVPLGDFGRCTYQAFGTWGGATLTMQGSNDNINWFTMSDEGSYSNQTHDAILTANGGASAIETPLFIRAALTTPGTGASVTVIICARK